ncbi:TD and POZ domain-containing protein 3 [Trichonephila inaurata madagascariensis]|uniref:TD and POZ domain-containing protein 3 n=1 Tax=Trichonephila inaurata madagascariensis TaxID=2747483 RepID=A0A8X7CDR8_9ARAC|nr:TD and POZ domain-containing protein 3 [Trichonephila inaurata madagascariensis]
MAQFNAQEDLSKDLMHLYDEAPFSFADVVLKCESFTINAHKCILSARSPVFSTMFKNEMRESQENVVEISDLDILTLRTMLIYIYTGNVDDLSMSNTQNLLYAAVKYQLMGLKKMCIAHLKSTVSNQNVLNVLVLGDIYDQDLKNFALNFICNKVSTFSLLEITEKWKHLQMEKSALACEVLISLVTALEEKVRILS